MPASFQIAESQDHSTAVEDSEKHWGEAEVPSKHTSTHATNLKRFHIGDGCGESDGANSSLEYEYDRSWSVGDDKPVNPLIRRPSKKRSRSAAASKSSATKASLIEAALAEASHGWQFDAGAFAKLTDNRPLSTLGPYLMTHSGVVKALDLDIQKVSNFFAALESGYAEANPFHNRTLAALKMHAMYALLQHGGVSTAISSQSCDVVSSMTDLEKLGCLLAAAMRDHEHMALTSEFLVQIGHSRAITYNDQQVNEHHHVASGFAVLRKDGCNFMANLTQEQFTYVRSLVIDLMLATSLGVEGTKSHGVRLLQYAMKFVDVSYAAQRFDMYAKWVDSLESELFTQGDRQKELGHPVSIHMDRDRPGLSSLKLEFLHSSALPLLDLLVEVAPGVQPMKDAVVANCKSLDARAVNALSRPSLHREDCCHRQSVDSYSIVATSSEEMKKKKTSGRTRQRRAKFYASVRQRTPSPEVRLFYIQAWDSSQF
jgi:hypothetical protein